MISQESEEMLDAIIDSKTRLIIDYLARSTKPRNIAEIRASIDSDLRESQVVHRLGRLCAVGVVKRLMYDLYVIDRAKCSVFNADLSSFLCGGPLP